MLDFIHPNLLALISATLISFSRVAQRYAVARLDSYVANLVMGVVIAVSGWVFYWMEGSQKELPLTGIFWFMAVGFCGSFAGRYLILVSMKLVGLARSTVISQTVLIWSASLAVGILGEEMTLPLAVGTIAIMLGASLLVYREGGDVQKRIPLHYYLFSLGSAFMYACAHLSGKYAFAWIPSSAFGMAVGNSTSFALVLSMMPFTQEGRRPGRWDRRAVITLLGGSVIQALGVFCFWSAIKTGQVTQVIPLSRLSLLLIIFLSWLFFRQAEAVTWRVVAGGLLALAGAFAVASGL